MKWWTISESDDPDIQRCRPSPVPADKTVLVALSEDERCLILTALAHYEDSQVQWERVARGKGDLRTVRARKDTGAKLIKLMDRIERAR